MQDQPVSVVPGALSGMGWIFGASHPGSLCRRPDRPVRLAGERIREAHSCIGCGVSACSRRSASFRLPRCGRRTCGCRQDGFSPAVERDWHRAWPLLSGGGWRLERVVSPVLQAGRSPELPKKRTGGEGLRNVPALQEMSEGGEEERVQFRGPHGGAAAGNGPGAEGAGTCVCLRAENPEHSEGEIRSLEGGQRPGRGLFWRPEGPCGGFQPIK